MNYFLTLGLVLFFYMSLWFIISILKKRNDIADVAWGLGFILMTWTSFFLSNLSYDRGILVGILVTIWGLRLSWHIYSRNKGKTEDYRYLAWRKEWGNLFYLRSYFQVYFLQGIFLFLIILPVLIINKYTGSAIGILDIAGVLVWLVGFFFESVGDKQLSKFISDPLNKGKIMQSGLWAYTRHPNYFGEVLGWWGIWLIALGVSGGWLGILGPITITFLILKVSGIPLLEKKMEENPEFIEYKRKVSMFVPLPRK
jgi:steroid 5-alpha reductase family enzyme